jgi:type II secretory pathway component GspD/PulD (secretin)
LEAQKGVDLLTMPEVTTLSGRQAQVQAVEMRTVFNGINLQALVSRGNALTNEPASSNYQAQTMPFGTTLDVVPYVSADGYTIQMTVIPSVTEFLGYDDPGVSVPSFMSRPEKAAALPLPRFRLRRITASAIVWDGQTLVLGNFPDREMTKTTNGKLRAQKNADVKKIRLFVFITPTIIDPAGNQIHSEDELPFRHNSVPPQPPGQQQSPALESLFRSSPAASPPPNP